VTSACGEAFAGVSDFNPGCDSQTGKDLWTAQAGILIETFQKTDAVLESSGRAGRSNFCFPFPHHRAQRFQLARNRSHSKSRSGFWQAETATGQKMNHVSAFFESRPLALSISFRNSSNYLLSSKIRCGSRTRALLTSFAGLR
jgi:hypothetical protein